MMKRFFLIISLICYTLVSNAQSVIKNGDFHLDVQGNVINAHGAGFIKSGDYYYWIGENRKKGVLVSCYRSKDLSNWEFRGDLLTVKSHPDLTEANIERPKVVYNEKTGKYVMWMHYEDRNDYSLARAAVAFSDDIEKPFTFVKSFRPFENMSRDCTLYRDDDGKAYFLSAARENYDLILYELTDDYLDVKTQISTLWPGGHREAPTLLKHAGVYYLFSSGCTGWNPNQMKYATAKSLNGPWSELINITDEVSYQTQPTYIITIEGQNSKSYLYVGDRWDAKKYFNSKYIFLPLTFDNHQKPVLEWTDELSVCTKTGNINK
jgi:hypothetical protein